METIQLESENGSDEEVYLKVAKEVGLDAPRMKRDIGSRIAEELFVEDKMAMNVSFLTLTYVNKKTGEKKNVSNVFTSTDHEKVVEQLSQGKLMKKAPVDILEYFERHHDEQIAAKEIGEVFGISREEAEDRFAVLAKGGILTSRKFSFGGVY